MEYIRTIGGKLLVEKPNLCAWKLSYLNEQDDKGNKIIDCQFY